MKKEGFTLIEVIMSIMIVSVVLVSMIGTLLSLKETYTNINEDVNARTYGSLISKVINEHFIKNNGIKIVNCNDTHCDITLGNNKLMTLDILTSSISEKTQQDSSGTNVKTTEEVTTLKYAGENYSYYKSLKYVKREYSGNPNPIIYGNKFTKLLKSEYSYTNVSNDSLFDVITKITIELNDSKNNIELYAGATVSRDSNIRYLVTAKIVAGNIPATNGWSITQDHLTATKRVVANNQIGDLPSPTRDGYTFEGWYSEPQGFDPITATSTVNSDLTIYPRWKKEGSTGSICNYVSDPDYNNSFIYVCHDN